MENQRKMLLLHDARTGTAIYIDPETVQSVSRLPARKLTNAPELTIVVAKGDGRHAVREQPAQIAAMLKWEAIGLPDVSDCQGGKP